MSWRSRFPGAALLKEQADINCDDTIGETMIFVQLLRCCDLINVTNRLRGISSIPLYWFEEYILEKVDILYFTNGWVLLNSGYKSLHIAYILYKS